MSRTYALKLVGALGFALGALAILTISSTADLSRNTDQIRFDVQTVGHSALEWMTNTIQMSQDRITGQIVLQQDIEFLMVRAKFRNAMGEFCESSFDHLLDAKQGDVWTYEILASGCTIDGVMLYAKTF